MPRIEIELTSSRPDGSWTWRAAGARQPKGVLVGPLLPDGAKVGDVLRAEADIGVDGIIVTEVLAPKGKRSEPERLAILGSGREEPLVISNLRPGSDRGDRGDRRDRGGDRPRGGRDHDRAGGGPGRGSAPGAGRPTSGRPDRGRPDRARPAGDRPTSERQARPADDRRDRPRPAGDRPTSERQARPAGDRPTSERRARSQPAAASAPERPPAKRLQPAKVHRDAVLAGLSPEQRPVAEQVLRGGIPAVRQAVEEQNTRARAAGEPEIRSDALLGMAEELVPRLRAAEWRDRAEAALADVDAISLRDLRTVVTGSDAAGRDDDSRELAAKLRESLERRSAGECKLWLDEITGSLAEGRVVRALRLSGRPPEPGFRFPAELTARLSAAAGEAMGPDTTPDRWGALLEAVLASPVRRTVQPRGLPVDPGEQLAGAVRLAAPRVPALAVLTGAPRPSRPGPGGRLGPPPPPPPPRRAVAPPPVAAEPVAVEPVAAEPVAAEPVPEPAPQPEPAAAGE